MPGRVAASPASSSSSPFDLTDCLDIDVTSASSAKWRSEYRAEYKDHRSVNRGGRRAAHWSRVAERRTAALLAREKQERLQRGETVPEGWPAYAVRYTHREGGEDNEGRGGEMVSVLSEMKTRTDLVVPVSAIKRPVKISPAVTAIAPITSVPTSTLTQPQVALQH